MYYLPYYALRQFDIVLLFHNGETAVDIIQQIDKELLPKVAQELPQRNKKEVCISLKYPAPNESEYIFNRFFDSPKCASLLYSSFNGVFIIDCTDYNTPSLVMTTAFEKLVSYVNEEANSEFKFVLILNQAVKSNVENKFKDSFSCDLILSAAFLKDFIKFDEEIKKYLGDRFIKGDQELRKLSPAQLRTCVEKIKTDPDNYKEIVEAAIANTSTERKIGF